MYFKTEKGPVRVSSAAIQQAKMAPAENYADNDLWFSKYYYWIIGIAVIAIVVVAYMIYNKQNKK